MLGARWLVIYLAIVLATLVFAARPAFSAPDISERNRATSIDTTSHCADSEEQAFLGLLNDYRASQGVAPVALGQSVSAAAEHHSLSMGTYNYFDHFLVPEGISFGANMINHGYSPYTWKGENIAGAYDTAAAVFQAWQNSPSHNENMLSATWVVAGIGQVYVAGSTYGWYWTLDLGSGADTAATLCASAAVPTSTRPSVCVRHDQHLPKKCRA